MKQDLRPHRVEKLLVTGPMVGRLPGKVTTQGEIMSDWLSRDGVDVLSVSSKANRYHRLLDCLWTTWKSGPSHPVHCNQVYSGPSFVFTDLVTRVAKARKQRIVLCLRGGDLPKLFERKPDWSRAVLGRADKIVAPSHYLHEAAEALGLRASVIPNIVNVDSYPYRHREHLAPKFFWMRSYHEIWNPLMAVDVMKELVPRYPDAKLVMGGQDKGLKAAVESRVAAEGLSRNVEVRGFMSPEQKFAAGDEADIFLNTNRVDNMPVAVVEACAMGLIVVATNVGGIPYLLSQEQTGMLVPAGDVKAMVDSVVRLLEDRELAGRLSRNGRALALESSPSKVIPQWRSIISELANQ